MDKRVEWVKDTKPGVYLLGNEIFFTRYGWQDNTEKIVSIREDSIETNMCKYFGLGREAIRQFNYLFEKYNELVGQLVAREYGKND